MTVRLHVRLPIVLVALLAAVVALPGCGPDERESPTAKKLRTLGGFYLEFAAANGGHGPTTEQEFKKQLKATSDQVLSLNGIDRAAIDQLFISDRDQEPFVVVYGTTIKGVSGNSAPVVAHEKTGKNGKKLVGFANGKADLVSEDRLNELLTASP